MMMMTRVLFATAAAGLAAAAGTTADENVGEVAPRNARRLQEEHRRRNFWNGIGNAATDVADFFVDMGDLSVPMNQVFTGVWKDVEDFFTEDMVSWLENDWATNVRNWEAIGDFTSDTFTTGWTAMVHGLDVAWEWTEDAAVTAWSETEDFFQEIGCVAEEIWWGDAEVCTSCLKEACNASLNEDLIAQIDASNEIAIMDMNNQFEPMFQGCASAMESCPTISDCTALSSLPEATRAYIAPQLAQCNLCYQCLPYGSTQKGCQKALDQAMPNNCQGCSKEQQMMYNAFFSCSSLKAIHDSITALGEQYVQGGTGHKSLDQICDLCVLCSDYEKELRKTCTDWVTITQGYYPGDVEPSVQPWDCQPPAIPDVLMPEGINV